MQFGHARFLEALNLWDPLLPHDILLAAFVCSRSPRAVADHFDSRFLRWRLGLWMRVLGSRWNWDRSREMWRRYVAFHLAEPFYIEAQTVIAGKTINSTRPVNTPWLSHIRITLLADGGYAADTFDEQLMGQVMLDYLSLAELRGTITLSRVTREQKRALDLSRKRA